MAAASVQEMRYFIRKLLSLLVVLCLFNALLQVVLSDFWQQPMPLHTKLGVFGYENMVMLLCLGLLFSVAYLLFRVGRQWIALSCLLVSVAIVELIMVASWIHFDNFNRFMGVYAMQMLVQDGAQLLSFTSKMPSAVNRPVLLAAALLLLVQAFIIFSRGRAGRLFSAALAPVSLLTVAASVLSSAVWNHAEAVPVMGDLRSEKVLQRVKDSEFLMLTSRSGPFTEIAQSVSSVLFSKDVKLSIQTDRLVRQEQALKIADDGVTKYNVVYILVESLHPGILEAYGGNPQIMPTVNELARESLVFANAFSQASHSNYADVSALSGQYPLRSMNIHFYPKDGSYPKSLPYDMLEPLGYKVGLFSSQNEKWGQMENYLASPSVDLFSHVGSVRKSPAKTYGGVQITEFENGQKQIGYNDFMYQGSGDEIERLDGITTDIALDWLGGHEPGTPFFMYFNFQASHTPFNALPEDFDPVFFTEDDSNAERVRKGYTENVPLNYVLKAYWDTLHYVDQNIARVVSHLKETGQHDNTIYVITADTSIRFSAGLIGNGGDLYPDVLKVPVVMRVPGHGQREVITEPIEQIDIMPTVLSAIGVGPHPASQGVDVMEHRDPDRVVYAVAQTPASHQYSAIYRNWQLIHDFNIDKYSFSYIGDDKSHAVDHPLSARDAEWMMEKLATWRNAQIAYYASPSVHTRYYPPHYESMLWRSAEQPVVISESQAD
ncbi:MAG: sulfatase-like hydrolase/transferase [Granulosicoccus sp.]|nr:sulfatase-like hydrolase/transferase [Granulosicoccus sp.]